MVTDIWLTTTLLPPTHQIRRYSDRHQDTPEPALQTKQTRPDLFPSANKNDAMQGGGESNVAALAMDSSQMPSMASLNPGQ